MGDDVAAVAMDFGDVFAGVGMGAGHVDGQGFVDGMRFCIEDMAVEHLPGMEDGVGGKGLEAGLEDGEGRRAADADDCDSALSVGRCDGCDGFVHSFLRGKNG